MSVIHWMLGVALVASGCGKSLIDPAAGAAPPAEVIPDVDVSLFAVDHPEQFPLVAATERRTAPELLEDEAKERGNDRTWGSRAIGGPAPTRAQFAGVT